MVVNTMGILSYDDVLASIDKNRGKRKFHILVGNGFSMAYDAGIFSYNALHDFVSDLEDEDLLTILGVVETKNFEVIMQQLGTFSSLVQALEGDSNLRQRIDASTQKLKQSLIDAVNALHPDYVFEVPEERIRACAAFLDSYLQTDGNIYSTNYDLLLYWTLLRSENDLHNDGFGRELLNPDEVARGADQDWSDLYWGKNKSKQKVFYLHGALPFFDTGVEILKEIYDGSNYLLENIADRMNNGHYPVFVTAGDGKQKLAHIMHNKYLTWCYESLCSLDGSLVTFGFNFGEYDGHIIEGINRATKQRGGRKLLSVYIGAYSDEDKQHIESIRHMFKCKVNIFDAQTVNVWG